MDCGVVPSGAAVSLDWCRLRYVLFPFRLVVGLLRWGSPDRVGLAAIWTAPP